MSQIHTQNDNNHAVAASDFDQPNEMPEQQETQQQQFGLTESTRNFILALKAELMNEIKMLAEQQKQMMAQFQAKIQTLQQKTENLELKAEMRSLNETVKQNAKYQALEAKVNEVAQMLSTQKEAHRKAADLVIHLDTFKEFVKYLEAARFLTDARVMRDFWPLFYQIFMHVPRDELNEAIKYFLSVEPLFEKGLRDVDPLKFLWQTYPDFARAFSSAAAFILDPTELPIDYEYHQKCQKLSFFLLIKFRDSLRELTVWAMKKGTPAVDNLIRYFCCYPAFVRHPLKKPENPAFGKEGDPLALRMIRNLDNLELNEVTTELKADYLKRIVEGITNPCKILVREGEDIQPIMDPDSFGDILVRLELRINGWA